MFPFIGGASRPISIVDSTSENATTGETFDLDVPDHQDGDYLFVLASWNSADAFTTVPSGWTTLLEETAAAERMGVYYRIADSEPASYEWVSDDAHSTLCISVRGVKYFTLGTHTVSNASAASEDIASVATYPNGKLIALTTTDNVGSLSSFSLSGHSFDTEIESGDVGGLSGNSIVAITTTLTAGEASGTGTATIDANPGLVTAFLAVG